MAAPISGFVNLRETKTFDDDKIVDLQVLHPRSVARHHSAG